MGSLSGTVVWGILWRTEKSDPPKPPVGRLQRSPEIESYYTVSFQSGLEVSKKLCLFFCGAAPVVAVVVVVVLVVFLQEPRNHIRVKQLCSCQVGLRQAQS